MAWWPALSAVALAVVHLMVGRMRFLDVVPRSRWLSFAGGAAAAYVFLHLLPELASHEGRIAGALGIDRLVGGQAVYAVALAGLVVFYGLERLIRARRPEGDDGAFRIHLGSYAIYNGLIGYLLYHRETEGLVPLALFTVAMGLHFLTTDFGLRLDHRERYDRWGRWLLVAALLSGAALGALTRVPEWGVALLFAGLAGGVLLNVLKEELPEDRRSRFIPFLAGVVGYGALLVVA